MSAGKRRTLSPAKNADVDFAPELPIDLTEQFRERPAERITEPATLVSVELPIGEYREKQNRPSHVEARLSPKQGRALQRLLNGLNAKYGRGWGPKDFSFADVLRWLLDQLPD